MDNKINELYRILTTHSTMLDIEKEIVLNSNLKPARDFVQKHSKKIIEIEDKSIIIQFLSFIKLESAYSLEKLRKDKKLEKLILSHPGGPKNKNDYDTFMDTIMSDFLQVRPL
jgi:hypothetical protein